MSTPPISSQADAQLGALISDHPQTVVGSRGRMIQTYVALGVGGVLLLTGLIAFVTMAETAGQGALICLGFGGFCALGIGLMGFFDARNTRDMSLRLYERGLRYADKAGQKTWAWDAIESIVQHQNVNHNTNVVRYSYQLFHRSGDTLLFYDHVRDPDAAIATVRQKVYALLLPKLSAAFEAGRPVAFGAVTIESAGLQIKGRPIAWSEIAGARLTGGTLMIEKHGGGWFNDAEINRSEVANVELLLQIVAQRLGGSG